MNVSFRIFQSNEELRREQEINTLKDYINKLVIQGYSWDSTDAFHSTYLFFYRFLFSMLPCSCNSLIRSVEGLTLETSALDECLYGGQITYQLIW